MSFIIFEISKFCVQHSDSTFQEFPELYYEVKVEYFDIVFHRFTFEHLVEFTA